MLCMMNKNVKFWKVSQAPITHVMQHTSSISHIKAPRSSQDNTFNL